MLSITNAHHLLHTEKAKRMAEDKRFIAEQRARQDPECLASFDFFIRNTTSSAYKQLCKIERTLECHCGAGTGWLIRDFYSGRGQSRLCVLPETRLVNLSINLAKLWQNKNVTQQEIDEQIVLALGLKGDWLHGSIAQKASPKVRDEIEANMDILSKELREALEREARASKCQAEEEARLKVLAERQAEEEALGRQEEARLRALAEQECDRLRKWLAHLEQQQKPSDLASQALQPMLSSNQTSMLGKRSANELGSQEEPNSKREYSPKL
jgi:hypothetical protein